MKLFELPSRLFEEENETAGSTGNTEGNSEEQQAEESSEETPEETAENEEEEISAADLKQAKELFKLLKDPQTATNTIRVLAQRTGLLDATTVKEVKENKKELKDIVKEKLGPEFAFLADKLSGVFESVLEEERATQNASVSRIEAANTEREVQSVLDKLARETKGESRKAESKMIELMSKFTIGSNTTLEEYLRGLHAQATAGRSSATVKGQMADKIRRNANDVSSRLNGNTTGSGNKGTVEIPGKKMSLKESVNFAMAQLEKGK